MAKSVNLSGRPVGPASSKRVNLSGKPGPGRPGRETDELPSKPISGPLLPSKPRKLTGPLLPSKRRFDIKKAAADRLRSR